MKAQNYCNVSIPLFSALLILWACSGSPKNEAIPSAADIVSIPDTGYTGIKQFMSGTRKVSEVNFQNGVREGLTQTFYVSGKLQRTFWYEKGLRQDSSCWFYEEGQLFRTTPFRNDTIHGIQKQYYRTGELKAELGYSKGYRTMHFREYTRDGKIFNNYPELIINTEDTYSKNGIYRILLTLSDEKADANFLTGHLYNGSYDTTRVKKIAKSGKTGIIELGKTAGVTNDSIGIIAEILTSFGNRMIVYKKLEIPYKDLN